MAISASFNFRFPQESARSPFLKSQLCSPVQWPPKETNLEGKVAIVTGSSSGLGLEASRQVISFSLSTLIMAVRSTAKGEAVASKFRRQFPKADVQVWSLEMKSYGSIQAFARRVNDELSRLDIAILSAGMQISNFAVVPYGTRDIDPGPGRLTIINSGTARGATIPKPKGGPVLSALDKSRPWDPVERYAISKLLAHLFLIDLLRYVSADDVVVNLADPGMVKNTDLQRGAPLLVAAFFYSFKAVLGRTLPVGASTISMQRWSKGRIRMVATWLTGEAAREQVWQETMAEFQFAGSQEILAGLKR
ncbi:Short-chain dehydrogenase/reductase [Lachnellula subtilissima]|uniref:Short-chain dehydrogenase/reductase n=1 Tax=Lachnellula subtilissima TaxID=602034 RepID=A0A8H8RF95_9HELO|nr:Short-chain dehydrogenase/reductase [Lachnellula subtilissima]